MAATFSGLIVAGAVAGPEAVQQLPRDVEERGEVGLVELAGSHLLEHADRELPVIDLAPRPS